MRRSAVAVLLATLAVSAAAAPLRFGPESPVAAPDLAPKTGIRPAVVSNLILSLAVWEDERGGIFGARVADDGSLLDLTNIYIGDGSRPAVTWTGQEFIVAWGSRDGLAIHAARVSRDGVVVDSRKIADARAGRLSMAANGDLVVITSSASESAILTVSEQLDLIAQSLVTPFGGPADELTVATDGLGFLVAALNLGIRDGWNVTTYAVTRAGTLGVPRIVPGSSEARSVSIASDGAGYLLAFGREYDVAVQQISRENAFIGSPRSVASAPDGAYGVSNPRIAWRGNEYVLVFASGEERAQVLRLAPDGAPVGSPAGALDPEGESFAVSARRTGSGVVIWADEDHRIRAGVFDPVSLAAGTPFVTAAVVSQGPRVQYRPAVEAIDGRLAIAWLDAAADAASLRLTYDGYQSTTPLGIGHATEFVDVISDGEVIWLLWRDGDSPRVGVRRFTRTLAPFDPQPKVVEAPSPYALEITGTAGGGGTVLLMWKSAGAEASAQFLRSDGVDIITSSLQIAHDNYWSVDPVAVFDGVNFAAFWRRPVEPSMPGSANPDDDVIAGQHFTPSGASVEAAPLVLYDGPGDWAHLLRASAARGNVVLMWQEDDGTRVARFTGAALENVTRIDSRVREWEGYNHVVALPDGGADVYWVRSSESLREGTVEHDRLTPSFTTTGRNTFTLPLAIYDRFFDAAATGMTARIAYERAMPELGNVKGVFVRSADGGGKRRAVR